MPSAVRAHTTATSATEPFVIQVFSPFRTQPSPSLLGRGPHAGRVRSEVRLGQPKAADRFTGLQSRQPALLLLLRTKSVNRIHHQRALHADETAQPGIAALQFLHDQAVLDVVHAGAAVAFQIGAEETQARPFRRISSFGNAPLLNASRISGITRSSTNCRAVCRTSSSCSSQQANQIEVIDAGKSGHKLLVYRRRSSRSSKGLFPLAGATRNTNQRLISERIRLTAPRVSSCVPYRGTIRAVTEGQRTKLLQSTAKKSPKTRVANAGDPSARRSFPFHRSRKPMCGCDPDL